MTQMCNRCGTRNANRVTVDWNGTTVATGRLCSPCLDQAAAQAEKYREQFDELISLGVNPALANEVMIDRINARARSPKEASA